MTTAQAIARHRQQLMAKEAKRTGKSIADVKEKWQDNAAAEEADYNDMSFDD